MTKDKDNFKFEDAIFRLENIVLKLEDSNIDLSESIELFEEGIVLSNACSLKLDEAKKKVQILQNDNTGHKKITDFDTENYK